MCGALQAAEKQAIADKTKGDVVLALVPLVDSFESARTSLKAETEGEKKLEAAYQARPARLSCHWNVLQQKGKGYSKP